MPVLIQHASVLIDVRGDLGLHRSRQHLLRASTGELIKQRTRRRVLSGRGNVNYIQHGCTFLDRRINADPIRTCRDLQILPGKVHPTSTPSRTDPQVQRRMQDFRLETWTGRPGHFVRDVVVPVELPPSQPFPVECHVAVSGIDRRSLAATMWSGGDERTRSSPRFASHRWVVRRIPRAM